MNKILTLIYSITSIGLAILIILSFDQFKLVPTVIVCLFAIAINYSIIKYKKEMMNKKDLINEKEFKKHRQPNLGRIFGFIAVLLISIQLFFPNDFLNFEYQQSIGVTALLAMLVLAIILIIKNKIDFKG